ncbi:MAG: helix-turn-helix transcriptional regulator [Clostridiales bacterium]|nr:helix-turn-helix transcriptional regulator [Clostridiales bacterium]
MKPRLDEIKLFEMTPLERVLRIFACDYVMGHIPLREMELLARKMLADLPEDLELFMDILLNFHGEIKTPLAPFQKQERKIDELMQKQSIIIRRHLRFSPPVLDRHNYIEILYLLQGTGTSLFNTSKVEMHNGDICIIAPGTGHNLYCHNENSVLFEILIKPETFDKVFFNFLTEDDILTKFFTAILYNEKSDMSLAFRTGDDERIRHTFMGMFMESTQDSEFQDRIIGNYFRLMCSYLLRDYAKSPLLINWTDSNVESGVYPILRFLENNYADISLQDIARRFHFSEGYLSRQIKKTTGQTFSELLRNVRLKKASELLGNPEVKIEHVMEAVGYSNVSSFSKSFKESYGCSPATYRNNLRK